MAGPDLCDSGDDVTVDVDARAALEFVLEFADFGDAGEVNDPVVGGGVDAGIAGAGVVPEGVAAAGELEACADVGEGSEGGGCCGDVVDGGAGGSEVFGECGKREEGNGC